jgi:serine/threonine protein kinase
MGVSHGGIKPSCVVFDENGKPYLADFALAHTSGDEAPTHSLGAPAFLAPEQWDGSPPTAASDQYSLAALAYLLFTGSRPYEGQADPQVRKVNFKRGPVAAHTKATEQDHELPEAVSPVLERALSLEPSDRYSSTNEFVQEIGRALSATGPRTDPRVFLSYKRDTSSGWAAYFSLMLESKHGIEVFLDSQQTDGAVQFPDRLRGAIGKCDVFVCLVAADTLSSEWVQEEVLEAHTRGKHMVPIFQEGFEPGSVASPPAHIKAMLNYEAVRLFDQQNLYVEAAAEKLAQLIRDTGSSQE